MCRVPLSRAGSVNPGPAETALHFVSYVDKLIFFFFYHRGSDGPIDMAKDSTIRFFEGPEKKVELVVAPGGPSLRDLGEQTWRRVVERAHAFVISTISNAACDAYLLSESSLFVYDDRAVLITCGRTTLVDAVEEILRVVPPETIQLLVYERKNEHFPEYQPSNFYEDLRRLKELMPGRAYRFGDEDDHHIHLFHLETTNPPMPSADDMTLEILMHGIDVDSRTLFCSGSDRSLEAIHERTRVSRILPGFEVDDHLFEPEGYSLNAINGPEYYTIHVTPQEIGSYVSFETNHRFRGDLEGTVRTVLGIFEPRSCDILFFRPAAARSEPIRCDYELRTEVVQPLDCGYEVRFNHFFKPPKGAQSAEELAL